MNETHGRPDYIASAFSIDGMYSIWRSTTFSLHELHIWHSTASTRIINRNAFRSLKRQQRGAPWMYRNHPRCSDGTMASLYSNRLMTGNIKRKMSWSQRGQSAPTVAKAPKKGASLYLVEMEGRDLAHARSGDWFDSVLAIKIETSSQENTDGCLQQKRRNFKARPHTHLWRLANVWERFSGKLSLDPVHAKWFRWSKCWFRGRPQKWRGSRGFFQVEGYRSKRLIQRIDWINFFVLRIFVSFWVEKKCA